MSVPADFATLLSLMTASDTVWVAALDTMIKVTLLLAAAGAGAVALGRSSAALRHLVWTLALTGALVLPMLSITLPKWQLPLVTFTAPASAIVVTAANNAPPAPPTHRDRHRETAAQPT